MNKIKKILLRLGRIAIGKKGVYGSYGKHNHFSEGVLVYENADIGKYNYFAPYSLINNCVIKNYCSIGPGCKLGLGDHKIEFVSTYPGMANGYGNMELFNCEMPTVIESDVWLGANVTVKQGVKIGVGAVVGAGAVVTHDIPPYAIATGIPARVVKYRFDEETIETYLKSEWYMHDLDYAKDEVRKLVEK